MVCVYFQEELSGYSKQRKFLKNIVVNMSLSISLSWKIDVCWVVKVTKGLLLSFKFITFISYKNVGHGVVFKKSGRLCFLSDYGVSLIFNEKMANIIKSANKKYSQKRIFRKHVKLLPVSFLNKLLNQ